MTIKTRTIIGMVLFIIGIMSADSECLLIPMALLLIGGYMAKDMVNDDDNSRENM